MLLNGTARHADTYDMDRQEITFPITLFNLWNGLVSLIAGGIGLVSVFPRIGEPVGFGAAAFFAFVTCYGIHLLIARIKVDAAGLTVIKAWGKQTIPLGDIHNFGTHTWRYQWTRYAPTVRRISGPEVRLPVLMTLSKSKLERYRRELIGAVEAFSTQPQPPAINNDDFSRNPFS